MTQFVACSFNAGGRSYTHHAETDPPLAVGDVVRVPASRAGDAKDSWQRAIVEAVDVPAPSFPTKPVLGLIETAAARAERKATTPVYTNTPLRQVKTVGELLNNGQMRNSLAAVASKHLSPERLMKLVAKAISSTPQLAECEPMSMYRGLMTCVELNLEPNSPMGHIYLIPFWNGRAKRLEVQTIVGYKGFLALAHRHPAVISAHADVVYDDDKLWEFSYGSGGGLRHVPGPRKGNVIGAYCYAKLEGGEAYTFLTTSEIIAIRDRSSGWKDAVKKGKTEFSPWFTHEARMFRKTAVRALANGGELPMSAEFADAIDADYESVDTAPVDLSGAIEDAITPHDEDGVVVEETTTDPAQIENKPAAHVIETPAAQDKQPEPVQRTAPAANLAAAQAKARAAAAAKAAPKEEPVAEPEAEVDVESPYAALEERIWADVEAMPPARAFEALEVWQDQIVQWGEAEPVSHAAFMDRVADRESGGE